MSDRNSMSVKLAEESPLHQLVFHLRDELKAGKSFDNPRLSKAAERFFGGGRGGGYYTPRDAYDAMEAALNLWLLEGKADELVVSPTDESVEELRRITNRLATQSDRTQEQVDFQQFSTPPAMAFVCARLLGAMAGDVVIEPSSGTANLAVWPRVIGAEVITNEIAPRRRELLRLLGFNPYEVDAELLDDLLPEDIRPNGVIMNPPFSATGDRGTKHDPMNGAKHIEQALRRLEKLGRLVAVSSPAMAMNSSRFADWWRRIASRYNVRANVTVGGREYAKFGTSIDTQLIIIDKDGPTPGKGWSAQRDNIFYESAESLEDAWDKLKHLAERNPREIDETEPVKTDVFAPYIVQGLRGGDEHPAEIVESASMAAVAPPLPTYRPHLPLSIVDEGKLSRIQLERVILAGQRHEQRMINGARGGFFCGDGTGVGKGRTIAAIITDNWNQERKRAVWFSVNKDLTPSAQRDLDHVGSSHIPLAKISNYPADGDITLEEGVIFCPYASLISESKKNGRKRIDQIRDWLGADGVLVFDEGHRAKNFFVGGRGEPTQTGQAVVDLQDPGSHPDYRIVYSSATGATEVRHMGYMVRLGLWGPGTAFPGGFIEFLNQIEGGGVGAMEMVSRDMKALGLYLSGSISFGVDPVSGKAVEYSEVVHQLTQEQREMYDLSARAWQHALKNIEEAVKVTGSGKKQRSRTMAKFWGDHQRFFNLVITAFKLPTLLRQIEGALAEDKSVIVSLVSTGEARTVDQIGKAVAEGLDLNQLDFTPREILYNLIQNSFPTQVYQTEKDIITGKETSYAVEDKDGNPVHSREAQRIQQELLDGISALYLPENPLDQLVNHFGQNAVAELTGRSRRLIRDESGKVEYLKRKPEGVAMTDANVHEMAMFQAGRKRIAIISNAASMGISLHASNQCQNKQRRVHITLQLGWSADIQMQMFGRSHRSDQAVPPEYRLLCSDLAGERRFCSTIARRLESLGALTKGERLAADSGDLAKYNFETPEGRSSLQFYLLRVLNGAQVPGLDDPRQALEDMGLLYKDEWGKAFIKKEDQTNIPRFLNRVLALEVDRQNAIFNMFAEIFDRTVLNAKEKGVFDEGVTDIKALEIRMASAPRVIAQDEITGARTMHYRLEVDTPLKTFSFDQAEVVRVEQGGKYVRHHKKGFVALAVPDGRRTDYETGVPYKAFAMWRPKGGKTDRRRENEIDNKFTPIEKDVASQLWGLEFKDLASVRTSEMHVIGGAILPLWSRLQAAESARLRVVRVVTSDGRRIVGAEIDPDRIGPVLRAVGVSRSLKSPEEIRKAVLEEGDRLNLVNELFLYRRIIHREAYVALGGGVRYGDYPVLRGFGMLSEYISGAGQVFFIPTNDDEWPVVLGALLKQYPPLRSVEEVRQELYGHDDEPQGQIATTLVPVDVRSLIVPVPEPFNLDEKLAEVEPVIEPKPEVEPVKKIHRSKPKPKQIVPAVQQSYEFDKRGQGMLF
jgi:hypothetical protein